MRLPRLILQKPKQWWLLGFLSWLSISRIWAQEEPVVFPQMATVTLFKEVGSSRLSHRKLLQITRQQVQVNGKSYTAFMEGKGQLFPLPFTLRIVGDSLLAPLSIECDVSSPREAYLLDSLRLGKLENTFFRFGAAVGTTWICPTHHFCTSKKAWSTTVTKLREIRRTDTGEVLYVIDFSEETGLSDSYFWNELVISRERGLVHLTGDGMVGGEHVYELAKKPARQSKR